MDHLKSLPNISVPDITLPTGGAGARKISEKFEPDLLTGGSAYHYEFEIHEARALTPHLALTYSSNFGDDRFGQGFSLNVGEITRKTGHEVPIYDDSRDTFIYNGQDLVRLTQKVCYDDSWYYYDYQKKVMNSYEKIQYVFQKTESGKPKKSYWLVRNAEGVNFWYGKDLSSQVTDPDDTSHVFSWKLSEVKDAKGNHVLYHYDAENHSSIYLSSIEYGNYNHEVKGVVQERFLFEIVLDYTPKHGLADFVRDGITSFRSGFEIRVEKLCYSIVLKHHLLNKCAAITSKKWQFQYILADGKNTQNPLRHIDTGKIFLKSIELLGYGENAYRAFPPICFQYQPFLLAEHYQTVPLQPREKENFLCFGQMSSYQFVDLYGEGLPGLLYSNNLSVFFCRNQGNGVFDKPHILTPIPLQSDLQSAQCRLVDLNGDHQLEWVVSGEGRLGYYTLDVAGQFTNYQSLTYFPYEYDDPTTEFLDLEGNGRFDAVTWQNPPVLYPGAGLEGFKVAAALELPRDHFPIGTVNDEHCWVGFSDLFGDGLKHRVQVTNDSVHCWPNLGNGRFGKMISFAKAPIFVQPDTREKFFSSRLFLVNITGSGGVDLIYVGCATLCFYFNKGRSFSDPYRISLPESYSTTDTLQFIDLLGRGAIGLLFSQNGYEPQHYYIQLTDHSFPFLMTEVDHGTGAKTTITYQSAINTYLEDLKEHSTRLPQHKLPFAKAVISVITVTDKVTNQSYTQRYRFHDGYYDGVEREFVGFSLVEHWDSENDEYTLPVYSKNWFHVGSMQGVKSAVPQHPYYQDYYNIENTKLEDRNKNVISTILPSVERNNLKLLQAACFSLKGQLLRKEIYGTEAEIEHPFSIEMFEYSVRQIRIDSSVSVVSSDLFSVQLRGSAQYQYEQNPEYPKVRYRLILERDVYDYITKNQIIYKGRPAFDIMNTGLKKTLNEKNIEFNALLVTKCQESDLVIEDMIEYIHHDASNLKDFIFLGSIAESKKIDTSDLNAEDQKKLGWSRYFYSDLETQEAKNLGVIDGIPLLHHTESIILEEKEIVLGKNFNETISDLSSKLIKEDCGYLLKDGYYWTPSLVQVYFGKAGYYLSKKVVNFGCDKIAPSYCNYVEMNYDLHCFHIVEIRKVRYESGAKIFGNIKIEYDPYALQPSKIIDENENVSQAFFDPLGQVCCLNHYGSVIWGEQGVKLEKNVRYDEKNSVAEMLFSSEKDTFIESARTYLFGEKTLYYGFFQNTKKPNWILSIEKQNSSDWAKVLDISCPLDKLSITIEYIDGLGRIIQTKKYYYDVKSKAPTFFHEKINKVPDKNQENEHLVRLTENKGCRWLTSGSICYNRKGLPIKKSPDFFSSKATYELCGEELSEGLIKKRYDPLNRCYRVDYSDNSYHIKKISTWWTLTTDPNFNLDKTGKITLEVINRQGMVSHSYYFLKNNLNEIYETLLSVTEFDAKGQPIAFYNPRNGMRQATVNYIYDLQGHIILANSVDSGKQITLYNRYGNLLYQWTSRKILKTITYDQWERISVVSTVFEGKEKNPHISKRVIYGDDHGKILNAHGKPREIYDQVGKISYVYDIYGLCVEKTRIFYDLKTLQKIIQCAHAPTTEGIEYTFAEEEPYIFKMYYNRNGRIIEKKFPNEDIALWDYNQLGLLQRVSFYYGSPAKLCTNIIKHIFYNAQLQQERVEYGNGVVFKYQYCPHRFWLIDYSVFHSDGRHLQKIAYEYDRIGNICSVLDKTLFYLNDLKTNSSFDGKISYEYDSLYRLKQATGLILTKTPTEGVPYSLNRYSFFQKKDSYTLVKYRSHFKYDKAGNLIEHERTINDEVYQAVKFQIDDDSNRVLKKVSKFSQSEESSCIKIDYDAVGNLKKTTAHPDSNRHCTAKINQNFNKNRKSLSNAELSLNSASQTDCLNLFWNREAELTTVQNKNSGEESYLYDHSGARAIKISKANEGGISSLFYSVDEYYKGGSCKKITLYDQHRCLATYQHDDSSKSNEHKLNYYCDNPLKSVTLTTDKKGDPIHYEAYFPFGQSAFTLFANKEHDDDKRFRYTGKERDEYTGFYYHSARYYSPQLCRWISPDPAGLIDGLNVYAYVSNNPVNFSDPTGLSKTRKRRRQPAGNHRLGSGTYHGRKKQKEFFQVTGKTHECEHIIGFDVALSTGRFKPFMRKSTEGRSLEGRSMAYLEVRRFHREHIGTGTSKTRDASGMNSEEYRRHQRAFLVAHNLSAAFQLNQLGYAHLAGFQHQSSTDRDFIVANQSFAHMIKENSAVPYMAWNFEINAQLPEDQKLEVLEARRAATSGEYNFSPDIDSFSDEKIDESFNQKQLRTG